MKNNDLDEIRWVIKVGVSMWTLLHMAAIVDFIKNEMWLGLGLITPSVIFNIVCIRMIIKYKV